MTVHEKITSLIYAANDTTGESRTDLTTAVGDLIDGYGSGGAGTPALSDISANTHTSPVSAELSSTTERRYCVYKSVKEVASNTTLTSSVTTVKGAMVIACFAVRSDIVSITNGWTLLGTSDPIHASDGTIQTLSFAYKYAESSSESFTVTQRSSGRIYINMISLTCATGITLNGFTSVTDAVEITGINSSGKPVIWGATVITWLSGKLWTASNDSTLVQLGSSSQPRLVCALDDSGDESVTLSTNTGTACEIVIGSLTVDGADQFVIL